MENAPSIFVIIKDIFLITFAAIGSVVAIIGLRTWRIQLKGKTDYELAKRLLKNIYSLRQRIEWFRNPLMMSDEISAARKSFDASDEKLEDRKYDSHFVYQKRWNNIVEIYNEVNVDKIESEVLWGTEVSIEIDNIRSLLSKLNISMQEVMDLNIRENLSEDLYEILKEHRTVISSRGFKDKPDDFTKKLNECIESLESLIKPHLK